MYQVNTSAGTIVGTVSSQWYSRPADQKFLSLGDMAQFKTEEYNASRAAVADAKDIEILAPDNPTSIEDTESLSLASSLGEGSPTNWSFGQLCSLVGAPASYMRKLPSQLVADNLNYMLMKHREEMVKIYQFQNGENKVRAITGPDYGRVGDYEVIAAVQRVAGNGTGDTRWKVPGVMNWGTGMYDPDVPISLNTTTLYASDRDVFIFLVDDKNPIEVGKLKDGSPDYIFRGFYVWNSEVGAKTLGIATMYLRGVCCNRLLWGVEGFSEVKIRHSKFAPQRFLHEAAPALESFVSGNTKAIVDGVADAKAARIAHDDESALDFLAKRKFNKKTAKAVLEAVEREEGHKARSVWDMAQGITAVARGIEHQDARVTLEQQAGKLLDKVAA